MTTHKTATCEEWLAARHELLQAEKELTRRRDALNERQERESGRRANGRWDDGSRHTCHSHAGR